MLENETSLGCETKIQPQTSLKVFQTKSLLPSILNAKESKLGVNNIEIPPGSKWSKIPLITSIGFGTCSITSNKVITSNLFSLGIFESGWFHTFIPNLLEVNLNYCFNYT